MDSEMSNSKVIVLLFFGYFELIEGLFRGCLSYRFRYSFGVFCTIDMNLFYFFALLGTRNLEDLLAKNHPLFFIETLTNCICSQLVV